jgi:ribosomal protein S18 acetylase RimI-like enzyme
MFGESALARFAGLASEYEAWPSAANPIVIGAEAAGHLVGVALATLPGECGLCDTFDQSKPRVSTEAERIEHEFQLACRSSHLTNDLPPHAHITTVATEPILHGSGVGRLLMSALVDRLRSRDADCVVLECLTSRAAFYEHCGFERLDEFADPGGPDLRAVLMQSDLRRSA